MAKLAKIEARADRRAFQPHERRRRAMFCMANRYYDGSNKPSVNNLSLVSGNSPATDQMGDLQSLLKWHYTDGVDNFERRRNQYAYSSAINP